MTASLPLDLRIARSLARGIDALYRGGLLPNVVDAITDTQVFIGQHDGRFVILFPGTASMRDLKTDFMFRKTRWFDDAWTHRGATAAFRAVVKKILTQLRAGSTQSVLIAGHSLGGMLATLCAEAVVNAGMNVTGVFTFGSPRVGNGVFAEDYDAQLSDVTYRFWNAGDPVPCVPPPLPVTSGIYTHVGTEIYLTEGGNIIVDPHPLRHWLEILGAIRAPFTALASLDHPIASYIRRLEAFA